MPTDSVPSCPPAHASPQADLAAEVLRLGAVAADLAVHLERVLHSWKTYRFVGPSLVGEAQVALARARGK